MLRRVSTTTPNPVKRRSSMLRNRTQREGIELLVGIVALMWIIELINTLDSNRLDYDGIYPRNVDRLWGILTSPFLHVSFQHLIDNTIPFVFMGLIIALRGARRLLFVTAIVIILGGLGTWLVAPAGVSTVGASGVVFGYATYLLTRGFFDRSALELLTGVIVGLVWGAALVSSVVPQQHISWQGHVCGGIAGVIAAYVLAPERRAKPGATSGKSKGPPAPALPG
jgi:membrane associated rhomboid family serine protease